MNYRNSGYRDGKKELMPVQKKGNVMDVCATYNRQYICCRVHVLKSVHNCPFECSYCFLQNYLTDGSTKVVTDTETIMSEVREKTENQPWRLFRTGTWELGDSLALEQKTGQAGKLITGFAELNNAVLELKTKSDRVHTILGLDHNGKTVVSWSLNPDYIVHTEEHGTASLEKRLDALYRTARAGYLIGLHFDPLILHRDWGRNYSDLVKKVFSNVNPEQVAWVSMGSLRFNPEMKKKIENNYPDSRLTCSEMVLGSDAKIRYVKPSRINMYRHVYNELRKHLTDRNPVYLCMERWDVWEKLFGSSPVSAGHLDYLFARSLHERYGLGCSVPERDLYEKEHQNSVRDIFSPRPSPFHNP